MRSGTTNKRSPLGVAINSKRKRFELLATWFDFFRGFNYHADYVRVLECQNRRFFATIFEIRNHVSNLQEMWFRCIMLSA